MRQAFAAPQSGAPSLNRQQRRQAARQAKKSGASLGSGASAPLMRLHERSAQAHFAGRLDEAVALLQEAEALEPGNPVTAARLGAVYAQMGRQEEAMPLLERAVAALPDYAPARINFGIALQGLGRGDEAAAQYAEGLRLAPTNPQVQRPFGNWVMSQRRFAEGAAALKAARLAAPKDAYNLHLLGICLLQTGDPEGAVDALSAAVAAKPEDIEAQSNLGVAYYSLGRHDEAADYLVRGFAHKGQQPAYQYMLGEAAQHLKLHPYRPELDGIFLTCLEQEKASTRSLASVVSVHLWVKYMTAARREEQEGGATKLHLDGILADALLIALLEKSILSHIELEGLLVKVRRALLTTARRQGQLSAGAMRFMAAFATQCHNNAYISQMAEDEVAEADRLGAEIDAQLAAGAKPTQALEVSLALYAMYRRLPGLENFARLLEIPLESWPEAMRPLIALVIQAPAEEQRLRATIEPFGPIEGAVSEAVRSQYEENPYPRWTQLPSMEAASLQAYIGENIPDPSLVPADPAGGAEVLVAGSGTGQHPLSVAARVPSARLIAVDLSLSSLSYAKRMAERYGIGNVEFRHGDLRNVGAFGKLFDLVECAGVLHHMEDPEEGFARLVEVTRPGGFLKIALYSERARDFVNRARVRIAELGLKPVAQDIRAYRQRIIARQEPDLDRFLGMRDFFDLDSLRDLIFHVQEHQFTIQRIQAMLAAQNCEFLGFNSSNPKLLRTFRERFPEREALTDFDAWDRFEQENPRSFVGMYQFTCRRPA